MQVAPVLITFETRKLTVTKIKMFIGVKYLKDGKESNRSRVNEVKTLIYISYNFQSSS